MKYKLIYYTCDCQLKQAYKLSQIFGLGCYRLGKCLSTVIPIYMASFESSVISYGKLYKVIC